MHIGISLVNRRNARVHLRLSQHGNLQHAGGNHGGRQYGPQTFAAFSFKQRLELVRRAGQEDNDALTTVKRAAQPLAGSSSIGVGQNNGPTDDVGLLGVVRRHLPFASCEALLQSSQYFGITLELKPKRLGYGLSSQVVFRGSETAAEDDDIGAKKCVLRRPNQLPQIVAHHAFEDHLNPQQIQLLGEEERVGIYPVGSEKLGPYRDDFGIHDLKV